ncbi:MAG: hypothetical protein WB818_19690 [Desulfobacterales bacterium]
MPDCTDRNEQVMLDVYGELDAGARSAWEGHLRICADCRREKENLTAMLVRVREAMAPPLSMQDSTAMIRKVQDRLAVFRLPGGRRQPVKGKRRVPKKLPGMAVADTSGKRNLAASDAAVEPHAAARPPTPARPQQ